MSGLVDRLSKDFCTKPKMRSFPSRQSFTRNSYHQFRRLSTNERIFKEKDIIVLRLVKDPERYFLSKPLQPGGIVATHQGNVRHDDIIGKSTRVSVFSSKGTQFRAQFPTTDEYITRTRRLVTPIYSHDAATIVDLLDIHVNQYSPHGPRNEPMEILEAGTGHGSLTIALAKEIHAANPPRPALLELKDDSSETCTQASNTVFPTEDARNAIIHTIDLSPEYSKHAQWVISNFRRGMYFHNINFYSGHDPLSWIDSEQSTRGITKPFLSIVVLDLPSPEDYLECTCRALHTDGILGVFCPNITQIGEVVKKIKENQYPLFTDKVVEFANNGGLKQWDVRMARVRSAKANGEANPVEEQPVEKMVCRPKVGTLITGGGFFATFRRKENEQGLVEHAEVLTSLTELNV